MKMIGWFEIGTAKMSLVFYVIISYRSNRFANFTILTLLGNTDKNKLKKLPERTINNNLHYSFSTNTFQLNSTHVTLFTLDYLINVTF
jgi:hypothetical protein